MLEHANEYSEWINNRSMHIFFLHLNKGKVGRSEVIVTFKTKHVKTSSRFPNSSQKVMTEIAESL